MEPILSVLKILRLQGELPQKEREEYKVKDLQDLDKYIINRLSVLKNRPTINDLEQIIEDAINIKSKYVCLYFENVDAFRTYCMNKFRGKLQTIRLHGVNTEVKGLDIMA